MWHPQVWAKQVWAGQVCAAWRLGMLRPVTPAGVCVCVCVCVTPAGVCVCVCVCVCVGMLHTNQGHRGRPLGTRCLDG